MHKKEKLLLSLGWAPKVPSRQVRQMTELDPGCHNLRSRSATTNNPILLGTGLPFGDGIQKKSNGEAVSS